MLLAAKDTIHDFEAGTAARLDNIDARASATVAFAVVFDCNGHLTKSVFAKPGTPTRRQWPWAKIEIIN